MPGPVSIFQRDVKSAPGRGSGSLKVEMLTGRGRDSRRRPRVGSVYATITCHGQSQSCIRKHDECPQVNLNA